MCGLVGIYKSGKSIEELKERVQHAMKLIHHRGPDDEGLEIFDQKDGLLAFGHKRLSIIDLSAGGHQPMHSLDGRQTIIFNGEIYNYRELRGELLSLGFNFRTDSDTEVLLAAWSQWGVEGLRRLIGMFAFVVYDRNDETLTLVRDAFGIKPLYYSHNKGSFCFASEVNALLKLVTNEPSMNLQQAFDYLLYGNYDDSDSTFYEDIHHLLPGHWMKVHLNKLRHELPQRWWWPSIEERTDLNFNDAADQLREMFLNNVKLHLRSDVPLGAALSGGIDSASIVCCMRHLEPDIPIHTFTFVSPGYRYDEEKWADQVNTAVNAISHKISPSGEDFVRDFDDLIEEQGEPFGGAGIYAGRRVYNIVSREGIKVTLDGQGGDELFAGYNGYPGQRMRSLLANGQLIGLFKFLVGWSKWPGRGCESALNHLITAIIPHTIKKKVGTLGSKMRMKELDFLDVDYVNQIKLNTKKPYHRSTERVKTNTSRSLVTSLRHSQTVGGLQSLLRHVDRNAMHWSVENRVPFLTVDLAEFALSLPEDYLVSKNGETKAVFRAAMRGIVPNSILDRRDKIGFASPEANWLKMNKDEIIKKMNSISYKPFLKDQNLIKFVDRELTADLNNSEQIWRILNFTRWYQLNNFCIDK